MQQNNVSTTTMKIFVVSVLLLAIVNSVTSKNCTEASKADDCPKDSGIYTGECTTGSCACNSTNAIAEDNDCLIGTVVKPACTETETRNCIGPGIKAECDGTKCKCAGTYTESGDNCIVTTVKSIACTDADKATTCTGYGIKAGSCSDDACDCAAGYTREANTKDCKAVVTKADASTQDPAGKSCTEDKQCTGAGYKTKCTDKVCECDKDYWAKGDKCTRTGKPCTPSTASQACTGEEYTNKCDANGRCECKDGYKREEDKCVDGTMTVVSSALLIAMAAMFSRLF